jgi:hypothetical protein
VLRITTPQKKAVNGSLLQKIDGLSPPFQYANAQSGLKNLGLADETGQLIPARKGDLRKVAIAPMIKSRTSVSNKWASKASGDEPRSLRKSPDPAGK